MKDEAWWPWLDKSEAPFTREWTADWQEHFDLMSDAERGHVERNWEQCVLLHFTAPESGGSPERGPGGGEAETGGVCLRATMSARGSRRHSSWRNGS